MRLHTLNRLMADAQLSDLPGLIEQALRIDDDLSAVFGLLDRLRDSRPMQRCLTVLQTDPEAMALIRNRALMPPLSFNALLALPRGSLGHTYGAITQALGYDTDFYVGPEAFNNLDTDADYVNYRSLATHDLHHVLTGFNFGFAGGNARQPDQRRRRAHPISPLQAVADSAGVGHGRCGQATVRPRLACAAGSGSGRAAV